MHNQESSDSTSLSKNAMKFFLGLCVALALAEVLTRLFIPVRDVGALFTVNDPVMGKRIKKNFHTVRITPEFTMTFTSNSFGFRGQEPDPAATNSILFIGDSCTMGHGVNDGEEFPALIKASLDEAPGRHSVNIINTGMGDSGNGRWIKLLKGDADRFKPRLVVLQVSGNDFDDNVREGMFSVSDSGTLSELPVKVDKAKSLEPFLDAIPGLSNSYFYSLVRQSYGEYKRAQSYKKTASAPSKEAAPRVGIDYAGQLTERLIAEAVSVCQAKGYPVIAVLANLEGNRLNRVQDLFQSRHVPTLTIPSKTERPDLYYKIDGHWNQAGNAFVASAVLNQMQALNLIPEEGNRFAAQNTTASLTLGKKEANP